MLDASPQRPAQHRPSRPKWFPYAESGGCRRTHGAASASPARRRGPARDARVHGQFVIADPMGGVVRLSPPPVHNNPRSACASRADDTQAATAKRLPVPAARVQCLRLPVQRARGTAQWTLWPKSAGRAKAGEGRPIAGHRLMTGPPLCGGRSRGRAAGGALRPWSGRWRARGPPPAGRGRRRPCRGSRLCPGPRTTP